jgi:hypothetical protein
MLSFFNEQKIESVISKVEEIDGLKFKQQELEAGFDSLNTSLNSMKRDRQPSTKQRRPSEKVGTFREIL